MKPGRPSLLTLSEEQLLKNFIKDASLRAMPVTKFILIEAVKEILREDAEKGYGRDYQFPESTLEGWYRGFRRRNPDIVIRSPETLTRSRRNLSVRL